MNSENKSETSISEETKIEENNEFINNVVEEKKKSKKPIIIIVAIVILIAAIVTIFMVNNKGEDKKQNIQKEETDKTIDENKEQETIEEENNDTENQKEEIEGEDEQIKEESSEEKEEEISFNATEVNNNLNKLFSGIIESDALDNEEWFDDGWGRLAFLIQNYDRVGTLKQFEERQGDYTSLDEFKKGYKTFYGSLDNFEADLEEASDIVNLEDSDAPKGSIVVNVMFGGAVSGYKYRLEANKITYQKENDYYIIIGKVIETHVEDPNHKKESVFNLKYKKQDNNNYIVGFSIK